MQKLEKVAALPSVLLIYLFGSRAKKQERQASDLDVAVYLQEPIQDKMQVQLELLRVLEEEFSKPVDLTILNDAGSVLKYQVAKHGKLLFERTQGKDKAFRIAAWKEYFDFQPTLEFFYKRKIA